jgi:beta-lactamase class A
MDAAAEIDELARIAQARISVWCGSLDGAARVARDERDLHPAASTFKVAVVAALHSAAERGELRLEETVEVRSELPSAVEGRSYTTTQDYDNDDEPWARLGEQAPLGWLAERAILRSSNLAANLLLDRLGLDAVNAVYDEAGATGCRVGRPIEDVPAGARGLTNTATAVGMAALLRHVTTLPPVEDLLGRCEDGRFAAAGLPAGTRFAHKPGWFEGVAHDIGIVRPSDGEPFVLVILTAAPLITDDSAAELVAEVARSCWETR